MDNNNDDSNILQGQDQFSVASNCQTCPSDYFTFLSPLISDKSKLNDYDFRQNALHLYDQLQKDYCECKKNHPNLQFCPEYFLRCFDLIQRFLYSFDLEIVKDFPVKLADFHYSIEHTWQVWRFKFERCIVDNLVRRVSWN